MLDNEAWYDVSSILTKEDFYTQDHRLIFSQIEQLITSGSPCDFLTLAEHMRSNGTLKEAGDISYLGTLSADTPSAANVRAYAEIVRERSVLRSMIAIGNQIADMGYNPDGRSPKELLAEAELSLSNVQVRKRSTVKSMSEMVEIGLGYVEEAKKRRESGEKLGIEWGIPWFDNRTGGMQPAQFIIIAARPSLGKTALLNQIAIHAAKNNNPGIIFSLEMNDAQLAIRSMAHEAQVNVTRLKFGSTDEVNEASAAAVKMMNYPLYFDTESYDLHSIVATLANKKRTAGIKWAAIDHIGLIEMPGNLKDVERLTIISRRLKKLSKQLQIPIIALSQLNRGVEKEKRSPKLSDLRDSGSLEQDADIVVFIHTDSPDGTIPLPIQFYLSKNRDGRRGSSKKEFEFVGSTQTYRNRPVEDQQEDDNHPPVPTQAPLSYGEDY